MAGHSQFKNIMHRKGAQDRKKAKIFARLVREISTAAKQGTDPETNSKLRNAMRTARAHNVPNANIDKALKSASHDTIVYTHMRYEAFGPQGVALIIDVNTDNKNRTTSEIRTILKKHGGQLGVTGSVQCLFEEKGIIIYDTLDAQHRANALEYALTWDVLDIDMTLQGCIIYTSRQNFIDVLEKCQNIWGLCHHSELGWVPLEKKFLQDLQKIDTLVDTLESLNDVEGVWTNLDKHYESNSENS